MRDGVSIVPGVFGLDDGDGSVVKGERPRAEENQDPPSKHEGGAPHPRIRGRKIGGLAECGALQSGHGKLAPAH